MTYPVLKCRCCGECFVAKIKTDPIQPRLGIIIKEDKINKFHDCSNIPKIDKDKYEDFQLIFDMIGTVKVKEQEDNDKHEIKESEDLKS